MDLKLILSQDSQATENGIKVKCLKSDLTLS
jgi:hypothetical protein